MVNLAKKLVAAALLSLSALFFSCISCGIQANCIDTLPDGGDGGAYYSTASSCPSADGGAPTSGSRLATPGAACDESKVTFSRGGARRCNNLALTSATQVWRIDYRDDASQCYVKSGEYLADSQAEAQACGDSEARGCSMSAFATQQQLTVYCHTVDGATRFDVPSRSAAEARACVEYRFPGGNVSQQSTCN